MLTLVASASPNGTVRIARRFRRFSKAVLENIEAAEDWARLQPLMKQEAEEYVRWHNFLAALAADDINTSFEEIETSTRIGLRKNAQFDDKCCDYRRKRDPGFRRQQRLEKKAARLRKLNKQICLTNQEFIEWMDLRKLLR